VLVLSLYIYIHLACIPDVANAAAFHSSTYHQYSNVETPFVVSVHSTRFKTCGVIDCVSYIPAPTYSTQQHYQIDAFTIYIHTLSSLVLRSCAVFVLLYLVVAAVLLLLVTIPHDSITLCT
jgi:hypothetical protein